MNYHVSKVMGFGPMCIGMFLLTHIKGDATILLPILRMFAVTKVQQQLGRRADLCMEFLTSCFCLPCAMGGESMELDAELGAQIKHPYTSVNTSGGLAQNEGSNNVSK
mmetsp:Transcript_125005/g.358893  ORF Transcript_125005/g.358893 Transcript_125005/m.358893 type:complete len:108 (-) Transcript_125005:431-754(-)